LGASTTKEAESVVIMNVREIIRELDLTRGAHDLESAIQRARVSFAAFVEKYFEVAPPSGRSRHETLRLLGELITASDRNTADRTDHFRDAMLYGRLLTSITNDRRMLRASEAEPERYEQG
jgi:hypothetical protein